jgi:hypothetical protein
LSHCLNARPRSNRKEMGEPLRVAMRFIQDTAGELSHPTAAWAPHIFSRPMVVLCRSTPAISKPELVIVPAGFVAETTFLVVLVDH